MDLNEQEIWSLCTMLTNLEDSFRSLKSELNLRPLFHRKEARADGHIFSAVLAYRLLHLILTGLRENNIHMQWQRVRERLASQVRITTALTMESGHRIYTHKTSQPESWHKMIYDSLHLAHRPLKTKCYEN